MLGTRDRKKNNFVDLTYTPSAETSAPFSDIVIPFKDGSSQIMSRPKLGGDHAPDPQQYLKGGSFLKTEAYKQRECQFFISDMEDTVDVKLAEYFEARPEAYLRTRLTRIRPGVYSINNGRQIHIECVESSSKSQLIVKDGPLRQPLSDYLNMEEPPVPQAKYSGSIFQAKTNLQTTPKENRLTFVDTGLDYSRLDAMKIAKEQAVAREAAAFEMAQQGQAQMYDRRRSQSGGYNSRATLDHGMRSPSNQSRDGLRQPPPNTLRYTPSWASSGGRSNAPPPICGSPSLGTVKLNRRTVSPAQRRGY